MAKRKADKPVVVGANRDFPLKATDPQGMRRAVAEVVAIPSLQAARAILATEGTTGLGRDLDVLALTNVLTQV